MHTQGLSSRAFFAALLLASLLGPACARDSVVFGTSSTLGIEVAGPADNQVTIKVGFDRTEGATMPLFDARYENRWTDRKIDEDNPTYCEIWIVGDIMCRVAYRERRHVGYATLAALRIDTGGLIPANLQQEGTVVSQLFATGSAAEHRGAARTAAALVADGPTGTDRASVALLQLAATDDNTRKIVAKCLGAHYDSVAANPGPSAETTKATIEAGALSARGRAGIRSALTAISSKTTLDEACKPSV